MPLKVPSKTRDSDTSAGGRKADPIHCDAFNVQGGNILAVRRIITQHSQSATTKSECHQEE